MEKSIPAFVARRQFGRLLDEVVAKRDAYVVERHGRAVAAVVPIAVYEQWKTQREQTFALWEAAAMRADRDEHEALALAQDAVRAIREEAQTQE